MENKKFDLHYVYFDGTQAIAMPGDKKIADHFEILFTSSDWDECFDYMRTYNNKLYRVRS